MTGDIAELERMSPDELAELLEDFAGAAAARGARKSIEDGEELIPWEQVKREADLWPTKSSGETASEQFKSLDKPVRWQIRALVERLAEDPRPGQATQLVGDPKTWRVRVGDRRVLYEIHDDQLRVIILEVGHRSEIY